MPAAERFQSLGFRLLGDAETAAYMNRRGVPVETMDEGQALELMARGELQMLCSLPDPGPTVRTGAICGAWPFGSTCPSTRRVSAHTLPPGPSKHGAEAAATGRCAASRSARDKQACCRRVERGAAGSVSRREEEYHACPSLAQAAGTTCGHQRGRGPVPRSTGTRRDQKATSMAPDSCRTKMHDPQSGRGSGEVTRRWAISWAARPKRGSPRSIGGQQAPPEPYPGPRRPGPPGPYPGSRLQPRSGLHGPPPTAFALSRAG